MFRKTSGAILCPSCGRLTNADAPVCLVCGRRNPGMWGFGSPLGALLRRWNFTNAVTAVCVALYVAGLVVDPGAVLRPRGLFGIFSPSGAALAMLGASGSVPWALGYWWTVFTAIYLHGGLLHIAFNVLWIRQLGPAVEGLYGPSRLVTIFTVAGVAGFAASIAMGNGLTVGASGSIFGLLGAIVAFGRKRGGSLGGMVVRQYGQWALILFVLGLLPGTAVDNWAHAGGFAGGFVAGLVLSLAEHQAETPLDRLLAGLAVGVTVLGFALALWTALAG
ncbi:MAG: rhomboid family intramembrane serine protease [Candidatus Rokuibacteriota bacterium]